MKNEDLKSTYNQMHAQGTSSWFSDGQGERRLILKMGEPWEGLTVLEIGCGEGDLCALIEKRGAQPWGIDYSEVAVDKATDKYPHIKFWQADYHGADWVVGPNRLVLQGVLEHLDDPFTELKWMMDNLLAEKGDAITSSPCFLNPRGIVWMTLDMLGAVMSKTDLHYLNPWEFREFCDKNGFKFNFELCDRSWAYGDQMIQDLKQRIPLALKDGNIPFNQEKISNFLNWLKHWRFCNLDFGATAVYKISK